MSNDLHSGSLAPRAPPLVLCLPDSQVFSKNFGSRSGRDRTVTYRSSDAEQENHSNRGDVDVTRSQVGDGRRNNRTAADLAATKRG